MLLSLLISFSLAYEPSVNCNAANPNCDDLKLDSATTLNDDDLSVDQKYACCTQGVAKDITISAQTIPKDCFACSTRIYKVILQSTVTTIKEGAFYDCPNLNIDLSSNSLESIEQSAFQNCISLSTNIMFGGGTIGVSAFQDCSSLTGTVTLQPKSGVTYQSISANAFEGTHVTAFAPGTVLRTVGERAFYATDINSELTFTDKLSEIGIKAFKHTKITKVTFASGDYYFTIGESAFESTQISGAQTETLVIPKACTDIGPHAFARIPFQGTVRLDTEMTEIKPYLFYNSSITRITVQSGPEGNSFYSKLEKIGAHAFDRTNLRGGITFGTYIREIEPYAFKNTSISGQIILPDSLRIIGGFAFYGCNGITQTITPRNLLASIGDRAFEDTSISGPLTIRSSLKIGERCFARTQLTELTIHNNVPESAFEGITTLTKLIAEGSQSQIKIFKNAFKDCSINGLMEFDNVKIETDAFLNARFTNSSSIARIFFVDSTIESYAFRYFTTSNCLINLTDTVLGQSAFETLSGAPTVTFHHVVDTDTDDKPPESTYQIPAYAFYNTGIQGDLDLPDFIVYVGKYAFAYCRGLTGNLNLNATYISDYAFYSSGFAGSLTLGSNVGQLNTDLTPGNPPTPATTETMTFRGCNFNGLTLANSGSIPFKAFYHMTSIRGRLFIPLTVSEIGRESFEGCTGISSLEFEADPNPDQNNNGRLTIGQAAFLQCTGITNPLVINRALISSNPYSTPTDDALAEYAFYECNRIPSVTFDTKLRSIDSYAFYNCTSLTTISLPIELDTIGSNAFAECTQLKGNLIIPYASTIGSGAFRNCAGFNGDLDLSSVRHIGSGAFYECSGFDGVLSLYNPVIGIYDGTSYIGSSAFYGCRNLKGTLDLRYYSSVGDRAFYDCSSLDGTLTIGQGTIEEYTFYRCSSLHGPLAIGATEIKKYAFYGCSGFSGIFQLSPYVTYIGEYAFSGCSGLSGPLELPGTLKFIGKSAFSGCKGFSDHLSIHVGNTKSDEGNSDSEASNTLLRIEERAFEDCSGFKNGYLSIYVDDDHALDQRYLTQLEQNKEESGDNSYSNTGSMNRGYRINSNRRFDYFLRIQNKAFDGTKFKNIYYNGRFQPDCDYDIGISSIKGIHTSANYENKTFCGNPTHNSKLSGGAIAGIVIACIVVVAVIVILIVYFIIRNKKNKDNSEGEVEMNNEP